MNNEKEDELQNKPPVKKLRPSAIFLKVTEILVPIINISFLLFIIYAAWTMRNDSWFWPLLIVSAALFYRLYDLERRMKMSEDKNDEEEIRDYIAKRDFNDIDINCDNYGYKLQKVIIFAFEPGRGLIKNIAKIMKKKEQDVEKEILEIRKVMITIEEYSDDLTIYKTSKLTYNEDIVDNEWIDFPKPKDYPWEIQAGWAGDELLFMWAGISIYLDWGKGGKIIVAVSPPDEFKDKILFEVSVSGKDLKQYSTIEDKGLRQHYKSYSNINSKGIQDYYWSLSTITHPVIYDYEQKYYKMKNTIKDEQTAA